MVPIQNPQNKGSVCFSGLEPLLCWIWTVRGQEEGKSLWESSFPRKCPAVFRVLASRQGPEISKLALGTGGHPWDTRQVKVEGLGLVTLSPESQYLEAGQALCTW